MLVDKLREGRACKRLPIHDVDVLGEQKGRILLVLLVEVGEHEPLGILLPTVGVEQRQNLSEVVVCGFLLSGIHAKVEVAPEDPVGPFVVLYVPHDELTERLSLVFTSVVYGEPDHPPLARVVALHLPEVIVVIPIPETPQAVVYEVLVLVVGVLLVQIKHACALPTPTRYFFSMSNRFLFLCFIILTST